MAIFKCKMCGGSLELNGESGVATCDYCGSVQTLPKKNDDVIANLFNRANNLRIKSEFDKAAEVYEKIINEDNTEAEAHWGLVLCKYGIEYVEDPKTYKRVPTCHRTQYESILSDVDFLATIENADGARKSVYQEEVEKISALQKDILAIVKKEKPFDVFVCYKETDENGKRTVDSSLANDIYYQLTQEGLKVFYAAITLEDKLGQEYEPYIFAALNSAKVMLVVGTKPEHFESVWVKNEWSRYLKLMKSDRSKLLIPCYRDMDAYDLPEEFSHLQAQDMSKIGFVNDVVRGIKKVVSEPEKEETVKEKVVVSASSNSSTAPLLKRAFMFLEDGDWQSADEYCEKVLDLDPECAEAYLGKLMAELKVRKRENLKNCAETFNERNNYKKAIRFGNEKLKKELEGYIDFITERNLTDAYNVAVNAMNNAQNEEDFKRAAFKFQQISHYKDSKSLETECLEKAEVTRLENLYNTACEIMDSAQTEMKYKTAAEDFEAISDFRDSAEKAKLCLEKAEVARLENLYNIASEIMDSAQTEMVFKTAAKDFEAISDFKDSAEKAKLCLEKAEVARKDAILEDAKALATYYSSDRYEKAIAKLETISEWKNASTLIEKYRQKIKEIEEMAEKERIEKERQEEETRKEKERKAKQKKKITIIVSSVVAAAIVFIIILNTIVLPGSNYEKALELEAKGDKASAAMMFGQLGSFKDSKEKSFALWDEIACRETISASNAHTVCIKLDGTAVATKYIDDSSYSYRGQCDVDEWFDLVSISAGYDYTIGLKSDGTVLATGNNFSNQCNVGEWSDIVSISAGESHTVGLKSDGTVIATGENYQGQCEVENWVDIVAVSAGHDYTVGLKSDGTVVATEYTSSSNYGQCSVDEWTDVIAISAGSTHTVGLKSDGTVVATGGNAYGQCEISSWNNIIAISAGYCSTVALKSDGTVLAIGAEAFGKDQVDEWIDIVAVSAGESHTVGLNSNGKMVAVGRISNGQCDVSDWKDIKLPN